MSTGRNMHRQTLLRTAASLAACAVGCTGQLPGSFRLAQQEQTFSSIQDVNTKIDLLWVVDNSASMDVAQDKLRKGFSSFAQKYMLPTWDIRIAVITTDAYMADPTFSSYLSTVVPGTAGWTSPYIQSRLGTWVNPAWNTSLVNLSTGAFDSGVKYGELVPNWGPSWAKLLPGLHDGPVAALCTELMPYFLNGVTQCDIRDLSASTGPSQCVTPNTGAGESSVTQCVNTIQNDTVRSGKAILTTMPPAGTPGDAAWRSQLLSDFLVNVTAGAAGQGSERGLGSLLRFLDDNEVSPTSFFRSDSARGIIFVSDEEDQTMALPSPVPPGFSPQSRYRCDQASLVAQNGAGPITGMNGFCCSDPGNNCRYGSEGTTCDSKTIDGYTYTVSLCARPDLLLPVQDAKDRLDSFFIALDGGTGSDPNYFITSIVPLTGASIQQLQTARAQEDVAVGAIQTHAVDRGDRYLALGNLVGNGSIALNLAAEDYSPILDAIGQSIIAKKSTFTLARAPTGEEDMIVLVVHADGSSLTVDPNLYVVSGKVLTITDLNFVLTLSATDKIVVNYQPRTVF